MNRSEATSAALLANAGVSPRSEDVGAYEALFVEPIHSAALQTNANQLVFGRRGTGKTILFGVLEERINGRFPKEKNVAFYYTATRFRSSAEYGAVIPTVKEKTHAYFHSFIEKVASDVLDLADTVFKKPSLLTALGLVGDAERKRRERLVDAVLHLVEAARIGADSPLPNSLILSHEQVRMRSAERRHGIEARISAEGIGAGGSFSTQREGRVVDKIVYGERRAFDPSLVRQLLVEIVELLGLNYIVFLFDEWMSLQECQVEFAERLKQCMFGEERLAVKIAADQYQGQFNNAGTGHNFRGIEIGGDIFVEFDLDYPFRSYPDSAELFANVLYKRLVHVYPDLIQHFGVLPLRNAGMFVTAIFENQHAFAEVCRGAQGICRDFHEIVQDCAKRIGWNVTRRKIDFATVQSVLIERNDETYDRVLRSVDSNPLMINVIIPHVRDSGSQYFLVANGDNRYSHIVDDLLSKRFIHALQLSEMHPSLKPTHRLYEIDYGIYLDLMQAREYSKNAGALAAEEELRTARPKDINEGNAARFVIDMGRLEQLVGDSGQRRCFNCGVEYSTSADSYVKRRLCPSCFEEQPA